MIDLPLTQLEQMLASKTNAFNQIQAARASATPELAARVSSIKTYWPNTRAGVAMSLGLGGFDDGLIDEAFALAKTLRTLPAISPAASASARDALLRRNRLLQLLDQYVGRVRSAARFVFRHHPEIVRQATSAYARRLRVQRQQHRKPGSSQPLSG